jgi:hypothetical protein
MNTYGGQATTKPGVNAQDHAAVYQQGRSFPDTTGEVLSKQPFPIIVEASSETIDSKSRINFNKPYTVEHNIKVMNVGRIAPGYLDLLRQYFDQAFGIERSSDPTYSTYGASNTYQPSYSTTTTTTDSYALPQVPKDNSHSQPDKSFKVRNYDYKKFFRPGRVFTTLWTEQVEDRGNNSTYSEPIYSEAVYSKIRRFLVVKQGDRSCTCLSLTAYGGVGHKKRGINLHEHSLIYSGTTVPSRPNGISKESLKINLSKGAGQIPNNTLVNFGRIYTVETNVKVKDIGDLDTNSRRLMRRYYNEVMTVDEHSDGGYVPSKATDAPATDGSVYTDPPGTKTRDKSTDSSDWICDASSGRWYQTRYNEQGELQQKFYDG